MNCVDENLLLELMEGSAPETAKRELEAHLDLCPRCRRLVAAVMRDDERERPRDEAEVCVTHGA
ncbi:MAG: zf-HC2 domain-containing protein [Myxococcota bacterium]